MQGGIAGPMPVQSTSGQPAAVTALGPARRALIAPDPCHGSQRADCSAFACGRWQRTSGSWIRAALQHSGYNTVASLGRRHPSSCHQQIILGGVRLNLGQVMHRPGGDGEHSKDRREPIVGDYSLAHGARAGRTALGVRCRARRGCGDGIRQRPRRSERRGARVGGVSFRAGDRFHARDDALLVRRHGSRDARSQIGRASCRERV